MTRKGSPHCHAILWCKNPPTKEEEIIKTIDKYITCHLPKLSENTQRAKLVDKLQRHSHSASCKKHKNSFCRFKYPRPPSHYTLIAKPVKTKNKEEDKIKREKAFIIMEKMFKLLDEPKYANKSLNWFLKKICVSSEDYHNALRVSEHGETVILKRKPQEIMINSYNPTILEVTNQDTMFLPKRLLIVTILSTKIVFVNIA